MTAVDLLEDDAADAPADEVIKACLTLDEPKSFFLYAGAGSGKTRSLVEALRHVRSTAGTQLLRSGQRVGVITYTNAACDEIKQRLAYDPLIDVSTIHSFAWELIDGYQADMKAWVRAALTDDIAKIEEELRKGRPGTKAAQDRERRLASKRRRLEALPGIRSFQYSPVGDNRGRDALNHAEVLKMASEFLRTKPTLRRVLVSQYPFLLIDESQDTNQHLMDALLEVEQAHSDRFSLGLFGDTMQRIYNDGKADLETALPERWARPAKRMNHRCPQRVVRLINRLRADVDGQEQRARSDSPEGHVRLFLARSDAADKFGLEALVAARMAEVTGDENWRERRGFKTLILEHHMAAKRLGFEAFFAPLYAFDRMRTGLLEGTNPGLRFLSQEVLPLVEALRRGDQFGVAGIVRSRSPLLEKTAFERAGGDQRAQLAKAKAATEALSALWNAGNDPSAREVLHAVATSGLLIPPELLQPLVEPDAQEAEGQDEEAESENTELAVWREALKAPFSEVKAYNDYINGVSPFDTHQGVKGLEFPRVMVIVSDTEARGFLFKYEKLLGGKATGETDVATIDRTRRLFYVTCSRAEESLAIVAYTDSPPATRQAALDRSWFAESEIELV